MSRTVVRSSLCLAVVIALLVPAAYVVAGKGGVPLSVILPTLSSVGGLRGDKDNIDGMSGWSIYIDGDPTLLRVQLISNSKTLALDTRGAGRTLLIDFGTPHEALNTKCLNGAPADLSTLGPEFVDGVVETEALLEVLLSQPFPSLTGPAVSVSGRAKLWFTTIDGSDWRVDWPDVTVTALNPSDWNLPDGVWWRVEATTYAGLSKLSGKRTKPGTIGTEGCYNIKIYLLANEIN